MYLEDSFFTLSPPQQVGLIAVSVNLMLISFWVLYRLSRNYSVLVRLPMALALFYLFVWVSPQAYYQYYRLIFLDLPQQLVIKGAPPISTGFISPASGNSAVAPAKTHESLKQCSCSSFSQSSDQ